MGWRRLLHLLGIATAACALLGSLAAGAQAAAVGGSAAPGGGAAVSAPNATGGLDPSRPQPRPAPAATVPAPSGSAREVPTAYLRVYRQAAQRYGLDWRLLAAIGKNESDHGRSTARGVQSGLNYARCCAGPMQICTVRSCGSTWQAYAVDGNRDGLLSVYDPADAIFTAARLLAELRNTVGARFDFLLAAYNAGPGYIVRYRKIPPYPETQGYVRTGVRYMRLLGAAA